MIHAADTGISTNNAVDVAKESADFVLLEKDLNVLADGILEGRKIIRKLKEVYLYYYRCNVWKMSQCCRSFIVVTFSTDVTQEVLLTKLITDFPGPICFFG